MGSPVDLSQLEGDLRLPRPLRQAVEAWLAAEARAVDLRTAREDFGPYVDWLTASKRAEHEAMQAQIPVIRELRAAVRRG